MKKLPTCDWLGCKRPALSVGGESVGCCNVHHLKLPKEARRDYLMTAPDTPARAEAYRKIMDFHVAEGNGCEHRAVINAQTCKTCFPPSPPGRSHW